MATDDTTERLFAVAGQAWPVGGGVVVRRGSDGRAALLPGPDGALWARARRPIPWPTDPAEAERARSLLRAGLLERASDVTARLRGVPEGPQTPPVAAIFVPTRGPSPHLARLLAALGAPSAPVRVLVDDPSPAAEAGVRAMARGADVVGGARRRAFLEALAEESGEPAAVEAALVAPEGPWRIGALRNLSLLLSVGTIAVSVDDDLVPEAVGAAEPWPAALVAEADPTSWRFFHDRAEAWRGAGPLDLAATHGRVVGRRAASVCASGSLESASTDLIAAAASSDVVVTTTGLAGDHGGSRASAVIGLNPANQARMVAAYEAHLASRAVLRVAQALTVTDSAALMSPCLGLDGRAVLPPFFPAHRNSDGGWAAVLAAWVRPGLIGHLPLAVRHDPPADRVFPPLDLARDVARFRWSDLVATLVRSRRPTGADPAERLASLAHHVASLAGEPCLDEVLVEIQRAWFASLSGLVERARATPGTEGWAAAVSGARKALGQAIERPPGVEEHVRDGRTDLDALRSDLRRFAILLGGWTRLRAAAARIGSRISDGSPS